MGRPTELRADEIEALHGPVTAILDELGALDRSDPDTFLAVMRRHPRPGGGLFRKSELVAVYQDLVRRGRLRADERLLRRIRMKPVRTLSGVTPVTVLTKPWPCPGRCIFCPTDVRMPKSYLHDEPGAMRAEQHGFDPFEQVDSRIDAFGANGHAVEKIELLVLGGTWSSYPRDYQEHFLLRCFDAMNRVDSSTLDEAHRRNETAPHRNVGLVLETRPDHVDADEVRWLRHLGCTKVQMGAQSLDDRVLRLNRRGHTVAQTRQAMQHLRAAGFKLVLHWMPNLHGATLESDYEDFRKLWSDPALRPDEIKIYSTQLLPNAELHDYYQRGEYRPYAEEDLLELVMRCKESVPAYCRINRVYRDIPGHNVVAGTRLTNMRQVVKDRMERDGRTCACIRCREVRASFEGEPVAGELDYETSIGREHFLHFDTVEGRLAGYLRLCLPDARAPHLGIEELEGAALVREVHVYGPAQRIGGRSGSAAQHRGLGTRLLARAEEIARGQGYRRMAIIAAVGTRGYYRQRGYRLEGTYMTRELSEPAT